MSTTQILFNSPALHSLKREQLVKLCKIHSIKANGRNAELIERLKQRAQELPHDDEDNDDNDGHRQEQRHDLHIGGLSFVGPNEVPKLQMPRPSEQWEVVMEDIPEVRESSSLGTISSQGSLRIQGGAGEFGTGNSKTSTVSSSLRALATSLGIKRATSTKSSVGFPPAITRATGPHGDELTKHAIPYSDIPQSGSLPQTDHFTFSDPNSTILKDTSTDNDGDVSMSAPVPGSPSRPGAPAPANARLSLSRGITTTIRLITSTSNHFEEPSTPHLAPYQTTFDLEMGSPAPNAIPGHCKHVWPASPTSNFGRLYPMIPIEDMAQVAAKPAALTTGEEDVEMPGGLPDESPAVAKATPARSSGPPLKATPRPADALDIFSPMKPPGADGGNVGLLSIPRSEPFLFGSPLPRHSLSNKGFGDAAASVLEEMNKRLAAAGVAKPDKDIIQGKTEEGVQNRFADVFNAEGSPADAKSHQRTGSTDRFAKAHEEVFNKMDSIANHYAARRGANPAALADPGSKKRKSNALGVGPAPDTKRKGSVAGARVISNGVRKKMGIPGGFGDEDNVEEEEEEEDAGNRRSSKRIRTNAGEDVHEGKRISIAPASDAEELQKQKERDAIRRKLDANKARRRSSRGRPSIGGKVPPAKAKTSRFGFLTSAKSIVRNVWNMGAGSSKLAAAGAPSSIPVAKPVQAPTPSINAKPAGSVAASRKPAAPTENASLRSASSVRIPPGTSESNNAVKPSSTKTLAPSRGSVHSSGKSTSRVRSPIPQFLEPPASNAGTLHSRISVSTTTGSAASRVQSRTSYIASGSSGGTRNSMVLGSQASISSMGARRSITNGAQSGTANSRLGTAVSPDTSGSVKAPDARKRTSSLMAPTLSSLAKTQGTVRPSVGTGGRPSTLPVVAEHASKPIKNRIPSGMLSSAKAALDTITNSPRSPRPTKIFAQPLTPTTFSSPSSGRTSSQKPSLTAAAASLMGTPSRIPKLAVPPKPKTLLARKPRISRSRVIAKLGAQRAAGDVVAQPATRPVAPRTRSSMGGRKSLGGVKTGRGSSGAEVMRSAVKKRARQSEYARRRSRAAPESKNAHEDEEMDTAMEVDA